MMKMNSKQHHSKDELCRARRNLVLLLIAIAIGLWLASCKTTEYIPVTSEHTEHHWHTDSVFQRDSVVKESLTTVMQLDSAQMAKYGIRLEKAERAWLVKTQEMERIIQELMAKSEKKDTVHDSVPYPQPIIKEVPADPSWGQRTLMNLGWAMLAVIAAGIVWVIIKIKF